MSADRGAVRGGARRGNLFTTGGGAVGANFSDAEVPTGAINGVNLTYVLAHPPDPAASLMLFKNGVLQKAAGTDYTLAVATITYVAGAILSAGDTHVCSYRY